MHQAPVVSAPSAAPSSAFAGDSWGGLAAMLVALPSAIAFGVTIYLPLGSSLAAQGALAGLLGSTVLGMVAPLLGGCPRLVTAPCAPAAAMLSASAISFVQQGMAPETVLLLLGVISLLAGLIQIALGLVGIGRLIRFIPYPVVCGYLSGVGLVIIGGQIPKFLGVTAGGGLLEALAHPDHWVWQAAAVGAAVVLAMTLSP
ncbi:MAG TPA: SulP family inorganic anion transporter, partial [Rhodospirillaceae bacterium]|nr:SulP family inorganic anion transporter [Rhodospirillaceae bacterium]